MDTMTRIRPLSWQAVFILKKLAKGCYVRRSHGTSFFVHLHESDGTELDAFSFATVNALETRGFAVKSESGKAGGGTSQSRADIKWRRGSNEQVLHSRRLCR